MPVVLLRCCREKGATKKREQVKREWGGQGGKVQGGSVHWLGRHAGVTYT